MAGMTRRGTTLSVAVILALLLALVGLNLRVPYAALEPGPVFNTLGQTDGQPTLKISGAPTYPTSGRLDFLTVSVESQLSLLRAVELYFNSDDAVLPRDLVIPPNKSPAQETRVEAQQMTDSQASAKIAALCQLGFAVGEPQTVGDVLPSGPAAGVLQPGDELVSVDGRPVDACSTVGDLVRDNRPGDVVSVGYRRGGTTSVGTITTRSSGGDHPVAQVGISARAGKPSYPVMIDFNISDVGGPSAGLLLTLGLIDRLSPGDLTGGLHVAGTGTIGDPSTCPSPVAGAAPPRTWTCVGPIGGIPQKMIAARQAGATLFLAPAGNCGEVRRAGVPAGLRLARVETLQQALDALSKASRGDFSFPGC